MTGYALVLAAAILWSLIGVFSQGLLDEGVLPLEIAFWRAALGGAMFVALILATRRLALPSRRDLALIVGFAAIGIALYYTSLAIAIETGGISLAFILLYTAPAFVVLLARWLLGEPLSRQKLILVAIAMAGVALVSRDGGPGIHVSPASLTWGMLAGLSYASYYIFGKWLFARHDPALVLAMVLPLGALMLAPAVDFTAKETSAWLLLVPLGVISTFVGFLLYGWGLRYVEASRAVLIATVEPVSAALLATLFFGERFGLYGVLGAALIIAAALLAALSAPAAEHG